MLLSSLLLAVLKLCIVGAATTVHHQIPNQQADGSPSCRTPNNEAGVCTEIRNCQSIMDLLPKGKPENNITANFVRRSQCGYRNFTPYFCCPLPPTVSSDCGRSGINFTRRILEGRPADLGAWPWMVALGYQARNKPGPDSFKCGGSLISNTWVLTAAHCLANLPYNWRLTTVRLGDLDLNSSVPDGANPVDVPVEDIEIIVHSGYRSEPVTNDIGLLRLKHPVEFTKYIGPVCLMSKDEFKSDTYYIGTRPYITGWGALEWGGVSNSRLQEASVPFVNTSKCAIAFSQHATSATVDEKVLCAGGDGADTCQGDSGGPLMFLPDGDRFHLGGIVSFGYKCGEPDYPGVYTRVAAFIDWINEKTKLRF